MTVAMPRRHRDRGLFIVVAAVGVVAGGARAARRGRWLGPETRVFDAVNGLDQRAQGPAWAVMQLGSLGGRCGAATDAIAIATAACPDG